MLDEEATKQDGPQTSPYDFLNELAELDYSVGVIPQTGLADKLGVTEGVVRGAAKAISKAVPMERLKEDGRGKLTDLGIALVTACIKRGDTTLEAWVHGLMQAMKSPEHRFVKGETSTADTIDLGFLNDRADKVEVESSALALRGDSELAQLIEKNAELDRLMSNLNTKEIQAAEDAAYQAELDKLTAAFRGRMRAKRAFLESLENQGMTPEI